MLLESAHRFLERADPELAKLNTDIQEFNIQEFNRRRLYGAFQHRLNALPAFCCACLQPSPGPPSAGLMISAEFPARGFQVPRHARAGGFGNTGALPDRPETVPMAARTVKRVRAGRAMPLRTLIAAG